MKITVAGHLCLDVVHLSDGSNLGQSSFSYGGIFWTVACLANLLSRSDKIFPVFGVGKSDYEALIHRLRRYENVDTSGIFTFDDPTNQVHLFYHEDGKSRTECSRHISEGIGFERIKTYLDVDGIIINMVSGFDLTLETVDAVRTHVRDRQIPIHFDFHSLTLGIDKEFKRFRRPVSDWRKWSFMMNSIQMSEEEAAGLTAEGYDEKALTSELMSLMVNALILTRDRRGGTLISRNDGKPSRYDYHGIKTREVDPTGCGDIFGAAFFSNYLKNRDYVHAVEFGNRVAAAKSTFSGPDGLDGIQELIAEGIPA